MVSFPYFSRVAKDFDIEFKRRELIKSQIKRGGGGGGGGGGGLKFNGKLKNFLGLKFFVFIMFQYFCFLSKIFKSFK